MAFVLCLSFCLRSHGLSYPSVFCGDSLSYHICGFSSSQMARIDGCHYPNWEWWCAICCLFFFKNISFWHEGKAGAEQHSSPHLHILLSASQNHHLHISAEGQLKHYSLSPFFRPARGLPYVEMQRKGQGALINFTLHSRLLWTCLTFTQPHLVTYPLKQPGWNSHLMSISRLPPSPRTSSLPPPSPCLLFP